MNGDLKSGRKSFRDAHCASLLFMFIKDKKVTLEPNK